MKKFLDRIVSKAYGRTRSDRGLKLPLYIKFGKYKLSFYAMNCDWESLRIKIMKGIRIVKVLKKGLY